MRSLNNKKTPVFIKKADIALMILLAAAAVLLLIFSGLRNSRAMRHPQLEILTGNTVYGIYDLSEDREIRIGETNVCEIRDGEVRMTEAECPDQICVHSAPIGEKGGSIVCLPNHVVLRITDVDERKREVDTIAE